MENEKLLIIDDDHYHKYYFTCMSRLLEKIDISPVVVKSYSSAVRYMKENTDISRIILDMCFPLEEGNALKEYMGLEFLNFMAKNQILIPTIIYSTSALEIEKEILMHENVVGKMDVFEPILVKKLLDYERRY